MMEVDDDVGLDESLKLNIVKFEQQIIENPYNYNGHVALIGELRKHGCINKLRRVRENMQGIFPLHPGLWQDWTQDEIQNAQSNEQKMEVLSLYERATYEYLSLRIWMDYLDYTMRVYEKATSEQAQTQVVRTIFEKAACSIGLHIAFGRNFWKLYINFEREVLKNMLHNPTDENEITEQYKRVERIFKRSLSLPLLGSDELLHEYKQYQLSISAISTEQGLSNFQLKQAKDILQKRMVWEQKLSSLPTSESPGVASREVLKVWLDYIDFECNEKPESPCRIQNLFERAICDCFLSAELWVRYCNYIVSNLKDLPVALDVYSRAVRNCSWSCNLWCNYCQTAELAGKSEIEMKQLYEKAASMQFSKGEEAIDLAVCRVAYMRRILMAKEDSQTQYPVFLSEIRDIFTIAESYLQYCKGFAEKSLAAYDLYTFWAALETCLGYIPEARAAYRKLTKYSRKELKYWLGHVSFERHFGELSECIGLYKAGIHSLSGKDLQVLGSEWLNLEKQFGTIESFKQAQASITNRTAQVDAIEAKRAEQKEKEHKRPNRTDRTVKGGKAKHVPVKRGPDSPQKSHRTPIKGKGVSAPTSPLQHRDAKEPEMTLKKHDIDSRKDDVEQPRAKKQRLEPEPRRSPRLAQKRKLAEIDEPSLSVSASSSSSTSNRGEDFENRAQDRTVFVLNLNWTIEDAELKSLFSQAGTVVDVRHIRDSRGRSKGFAYIEFETSEQSANAVKTLNDTVFSGRTIRVSPSLKKGERLRVEPKIVFLKNLPLDENVDELIRTKFAGCGSIADVRVGRDSHGDLRGFAYLEFESSDSVEAALKLDNSDIAGHPVKVEHARLPSRVLSSPHSRPKSPIGNPMSMIPARLRTSHPPPTRRHTKLRL